MRPGRFVGLKFKMTAGAALYLVPDYNNGVIYYSEDMRSFDSDWVTVLGAGQGIGPADIEISTRGFIYAANYTSDANVINYAANIDGSSSGTIPTSGRAFALDMDRNADFNINRDKDVDTSILYFSTSSYELYFTVVDAGYTTPQIMNLEGRITAITGLAVDPWTHLLYMTGICDGAMSIIVYDPFYRLLNPQGGYAYGRIVAAKPDPQFKLLYDITVKDEGMYVLNVNPTTDPVPSVLQFDFGLTFVRGFGSASHDAGGFIASSAPGKFYYPFRFFAHENPGLSIIDDSNLLDTSGYEDFDKLIHLNVALSAKSWWTYPAVQPGPEGEAGESFRFFVYPSQIGPSG